MCEVIDLSEYYQVCFQTLPGIGKKHIEQIEPGKPVSVILDAIGVNPDSFNGSVQINGKIIPRELYRSFIPPAGAIVNIILIPAGGGDGKDPVKMIIAIAILAAAGPIAKGFGLIEGSMGFNIGRALIAAVGMNALVKPQPQATGANYDSSRDPRTYSISGNKNRANPYGVVPRIYGTHKYYPPKCGEYTEILANDLYYRGVFLLGYGRLSISDIKIGNTEIANFLHETAYQKKVDTELAFATGYVSETTEEGVDRFKLVVMFKEGLVQRLDSAFTRNLGALHQVEFAVQYSVTGEDDWQTLDAAWTVRNRTQNQLIVSYEYIVGTAGQYDVRIKRNDADNTSSGTYDTAHYWMLESTSSGTSGLYQTQEGYEEDTDLTLYPDDTYSEDVATKLLEVDGYTEKATQANTEEIAVALHFREGLFEIHSSGGRAYRTVELTLQYQLDGAGSWTDGEPIIVSENSTSEVRREYRITGLTAGTYNVRIKRDTADSSDDGVYDEVYWEQLKSITLTDPISLSNTAKIALRLQANDKLNGVIDTLNCICQSYLPVYKGAWDDISFANADNSINSVSTDFTSYFTNNAYIQFEGTTTNDEVKPNGTNVRAKITSLAAHKMVISSTYGPTLSDEAAGATIYMFQEETSNNPADAYVDVLRGVATPEPKPATRFDWDELLDWRSNCDTNGYEFNYIIDGGGTVFEYLKLIARAARAEFAMKDGLYSVVQDIQRSTYDQAFTPRNSFNLKCSKQYFEQPHALKMQFINEDEEYEADERVVYRSGYDADSATKIEEVKLSGITKSDRAWEEAMYLMAQAEHRPEVYKFSTDFEHLACTRGSRIKFAHDVILVGLHQGRITDFNKTGNYYTDFTVDEPCYYESGKIYGIIIRTASGNIVECTIRNYGDDDYHTFLDLADNEPDTYTIAVGDLFMFGEKESENTNLLVTHIQHGRDLEATLTCIDEGPAVYTSDSGEIPEYTSNITIPPEIKMKYPANPIIQSIISDESVLYREGQFGPYKSRALIKFVPASRTGTVESYTKFYQARYKLHNNSQWIYTEQVESTANEISIPSIIDGAYHDIQVRALSAYGVPSNWVWHNGYSINASGILESPPVYRIEGKTNNPTDPTNTAVTVTADGQVELTFDACPDLDYEETYIQRGGATATWESPVSDNTNLQPKRTNKISYPGNLETGTYKFLVKHIDTMGLASTNAGSATLTVTEPATPIDNGSFCDKNVVNLRWTNCKETFPIKYYEVWKQTARGPYRKVTVSNTENAEIVETIAGDYNYRIRARDTADNCGSFLYLSMSPSDSATIAHIQEVAYDPDDRLGLSKCCVISDAVYAPCDPSKSWTDLDNESGVDTWEDVEDSYPTWGEAMSISVIDGGDGTSDSFIQWDEVIKGAGGLTYVAIPGCRFKLEFDIEQLAGRVDVLPYFALNGVDENDDSYGEEFNGYEAFVSTNFKYVNSVTLIIFFFPKDDSGNNVCKMDNIKIIVQHPELNEPGSATLDAAGSTVSLSTLFSRITAVTGCEKGNNGYIFSSDTWSNDGSTITDPATVKMYLKNNAGAGVGADCAYVVTGF